MEIPKYTEMEERLLRENRDLRDAIKRQEREILDGITHAGVWIKKLEEKSRYVCELVCQRDCYESALRLALNAMTDARDCGCEISLEDQIEAARQSLENAEL